WVALSTQPKAIRHQRALLAQTPPEEMRQRAVAVENRLYESLGMARLPGTPTAGPFSPRPGSVVHLTPSGGYGQVAAAARIDDLDRPRKFTLTPEEANAWLSENFEDWMAYRGFRVPPQI